MLLRTGLIMMAVSVLLAAAVALVISLRTQAPAMVQSSEAEPLVAESKAQENEKVDTGQKLEIDDEPGDEARQNRQKDPKPRSESAPRGEESASRRSSLESLPVSNDGNWELPTREELSQIGEPRYFDPDPAAAMTLTIEALGLYEVPIIDTNSEEALGRGVIHVPDTAYPWDDSDQKNVFLAGHRIGVPGTNGRLLLFELDELSSGDSIVLKDGAGRTYEYSVTELFRVEPQDAWVADTLVGRDLLTLQTCTYPTFEDRLIVQADRR
jgi:sortase A